MNSDSPQLAWTSGALRFYSGGLGSGGGTERARIDSSGRLMVGTTNTDPTFNRSSGAVITNTGGIFSRSASGWDCGLSSTSGT
jgi:hypothetical protein